MSHISPDFIPVFGDAIRMTRDVLFTKDAQPFLIAGSGTLGWDQVRPSLPARLARCMERTLILRAPLSHTSCRHPGLC